MLPWPFCIKILAPFWEPRATDCYLVYVLCLKNNQIVYISTCSSQNQSNVLLVFACDFHFVHRFYFKDKENKHINKSDSTVTSVWIVGKVEGQTCCICIITCLWHRKHCKMWNFPWVYCWFTWNLAFLLFLVWKIHNPFVLHSNSSQESK